MNRKQLQRHSTCFGGYGKGCLWTYCPDKDKCIATVGAIKNASVEELPEHLASPLLGERLTARERYNELEEETNGSKKVAKRK